MMTLGLGPLSHFNRIDYDSEVARIQRKILWAPTHTAVEIISDKGENARN